MTHRALCFFLALGLVACSDDTDKQKDGGGGVDWGVTSDKGADNGPTGDKGPAAEGGGGGTFEIVVNEDLLGALEVRFLKGRCVARLSINSDTAEARTELVDFAKAVANPIPLDGSKPADDDELQGFVPASKAINDWEEDDSDGKKGPWLITTDAYDWIDGGGDPFQQNGFEAAAGENYKKTAKSWELKLELVNQGSTAGAEKAFSDSKWNEGKAP